MPFVALTASRPFGCFSCCPLYKFLVAESAWERRLAEVEPDLLKKRLKSGSSRELKTTLAPLKFVLATCLLCRRRQDLPSLGKGHPQDEDELERVVKC